MTAALHSRHRMQQRRDVDARQMLLRAYRTVEARQDA
jgi:hypothetical protein